MLLQVWDSSYGNIDVEKAAVAALDIELSDARSDAEGAARAAGVLVQYATIGAAEMDAHPEWKVIGRYGVGYDTIDVAAATERGIAVVNVPDYCEEEVATHAAALVLSATRRILEADALVRAGGWSDWPSLRPIRALSVSTLGLIGTGRIGRETIRLLAPFFGRVVAYDPYSGPIEGVELLGLDEVLSASDVLSLHCPLTPETHHIIDDRALGLVKPEAYIVNVSRGGLIDATALAAALTEGRVAGAAVDVLEGEPHPEDDPLLTAPRATVTNHIAWYSEQSEQRLRALLAERCAGVLLGTEVPSIVNRRALSEIPVT